MDTNKSRSYANKNKYHVDKHRHPSPKTAIERETLSTSHSKKRGGNGRLVLVLTTHNKTSLKIFKSFLEQNRSYFTQQE